jgi:hypothetical protein
MPGQPEPWFQWRDADLMANEQRNMTQWAGSKHQGSKRYCLSDDRGIAAADNDSGTV